MYLHFYDNDGVFLFEEPFTDHDDEGHRDYSDVLIRGGIEYTLWQDNGTTLCYRAGDAELTEVIKQ